MLLRLDGLEKRIADRLLFKEASGVVRAQDRIGIVGPNGAGKTTLLRILMGEEQLDGGHIHCARGTRLGLLRQEIDPRSDHSVRQEARSALSELDDLEKDIRAFEQAIENAASGPPEDLARLAEQYDRARQRFERGGGYERHARVAEILAGLGFDDRAADRPLSTFSGGWLMRVELAKLLLAQPDVLLLDEPTNHLDIPSIAFFEATLERFPGAVLVVSHDRTFLRRQTNRIFELDGHGGFDLYEGGYDRYLDQRAQRRSILLAQKANQDRQIAETERFIERFRAKATKAKQVQSRVKALARIERIEVGRDSRKEMRLRIPTPERSGEQVLDLRRIEKRYGDNLLYAGIDFSLRRGEKVALVGPNGAGKSTLLRIAAGSLDFDRGERTLGHNVDFSFFAQHQVEALDPAASVLEELTRVARVDEIPRLRGHLGAFLFTGDEVEKPIGILSGGEKARVALAKLLLRPANLLILDEPTNHLDVEACEVLEGAFRAYAGTLLFVSHDRTFINALATRVVEVDKGRLTDHLGDFDAYQQRKQRMSETAPTDSSDATASSASPASPASPPSSDAKTARREERERRKERDRLARKIEKVEASFPELESRRDAIDLELAEPENYSDPARCESLQREKETLSAQIDSLYLEWESLSEALLANQDSD